MLVNAVIVAAGKGERMGTLLPKPFLPLAGTPLLLHTLRSVKRSPLITTMVVVIAPEYEGRCRQMLEAEEALASTVSLVHGGPERQDSVRLGLAALAPDCEVVVIHDAARPFVSAEVINRSVTVAVKTGAALVAVPVRDTLKRVDQTGTVIETIPRQGLWLAQTPQTFQVSLIREAHARALAEGKRVTDDAALIEWFGGKVEVVPGDPRNFKITTPADLHLAEALLQRGLTGTD